MRRVLLAGLAFTVFFIPVLVQLALKGDQLLEFLADSGDRVAHVPWYYYLDKLISFEGFVTPLIWLVGIAHRAAALDDRATGCSCSGCSSSPCSSRSIR